MSVFTHVTRRALIPFIDAYPVGDLENFHGISEGVENTNYFVDTTVGRYVLTLFERLDYDQLPYFLGLMEHLAAAGVPTPPPVRDQDGSLTRSLCGKPAALVARIDGIGVADASPAQCAAVGRAMARLHTAGQRFEATRAPDRARSWWHATADAVRDHLTAAERDLLDDELTYQDTVDRSALPSGVIHADLFRDNALFDGETLVGLIDFYYACNDRLLYDLAVAVNDWCVDEDAMAPAPAHWDALLAAYAKRRAFTDGERAAWPAELRASALRFWLSRLYDRSFPRSGDLTLIKDPTPQRRRLECWRAGGALPLP